MQIITSERKLRRKTVHAYISAMFLSIIIAGQLNGILKEQRLNEILAMRTPIECSLSHVVDSDTEEHDIFIQAVYTYKNREYLVTMLSQTPPQKLTLYISKEDPEDFMYREDTLELKHRIWIIVIALAFLFADAIIIRAINIILWNIEQIQ